MKFDPTANYYGIDTSTDANLLDSHPEWDILRKMAKVVLQELGYEDLEFALEHATETRNGITVECRRVLLKRKT